MLRILLVCLFGLLLLFGALLLIAGYIGFSYAIARPKPGKPEKPETEPKKQARNAAREEAKRQFYALEPEDVSLRSKDGLLLRGWFFPAPAPSRNLVIFAHGYHNTGPGEFADQLAFYREELGFHCLFPDHRAHGRSEGKYLGFGALEAPDLLDWARQYIVLLGEDIDITLHGISMGGATVMLCGALQPPAQVKRIIEDCGYSNAFEEVRNTMKTQLHINFPPLIWMAELWCRLLAGYSLRKDADPLGKLKNVSLPMLFIHGAQDVFVPFAMGERLYEACPAEKDFLWIAGAEHAMAHFVGKAEYQAKIRQMLGRTGVAAVR